MDVLQFYRPKLDWSRFEQGGLSDSFWSALKDLFLLAHAHAHWTDELCEARRMKRKVKNGGWERSEQSAYNHQGRALWLAGEKISDLTKLATTEDDKRLLSEIIEKSGIKTGPRGHERLQLGFLAISEFGQRQN